MSIWGNDAAPSTMARVPGMPIATKREPTLTDVTVSIVHAAGPVLTMECLESLHRDCARRHSAEVVVLDNASGDNLAALVSRRFRDVRVIEQPFRAGFSANHNTIISATESRYVLVLNPDAQVPPGAIDALVDYLEQHPEVAVAGPLIRGFDGVQQSAAWRAMTIPVLIVWALTLGQRGLAVHARAPCRVHAVSACAMLARRWALEQVGMFDASYFMFSEEWELALRLDQLGLERHYVPTVEILHHGQESVKHMRERPVNEFWRSLDLYLARHRSRVEASVVRGLLGLGFGLAFLAAAGLEALPSRLRPKRVRPSRANEHKLHARNAFQKIREPGLKELADDWNRRATVRWSSRKSAGTAQSMSRMEAPGIVLEAPRGPDARPRQ